MKITYGPKYSIKYYKNVCSVISACFPVCHTFECIGITCNFYSRTPKFHSQKFQIHFVLGWTQESALGTSPGESDAGGL